MHLRSKKNKLLLLFARKYLVLLLLIPLFFSCSTKKTPEFTFVGRWKTDRNGTISQMSASKRGHYDSLPEPVKELFKKTLDGRFYEFKPDGIVIFSISRNGKANSFMGTWKFNADSNKLITTTDKDLDTRFIVSITSPDKVVLKNEKAVKGSMQDDWVLQRITN